MYMYRNILYMYVYVLTQNTQFVSLASYLYCTKYILKLTMGTQNGRLRVKLRDEILQVHDTVVCNSS